MSDDTGARRPRTTLQLIMKIEEASHASAAREGLNAREKKDLSSIWDWCLDMRRYLSSQKRRRHQGER